MLNESYILELGRSFLVSEFIFGIHQSLVLILILNNIEQTVF